MRNLTDKIEAYLKQMLTLAVENAIEIQRSELAQIFKCVPSQINYVLGTRFTPEQGYLVETRRGGGGYVRIIQLAVAREPELQKLAADFPGEGISQTAAAGLIIRLFEEGLLTAREALLMKAVIDRKTLLLPLPERDALRSRLMQSMLWTIMREDF
jgi:transcriptional regulator CtsR